MNINNLNNNNNINSKNSNNNNNNNNYNINNKNEELFLKIWRNKYLRNRIFHQIKKYSINRIKEYKDCKEIKNLENSYYIKDLRLLENSEIPIGGIPNSVIWLRMNKQFNHRLLVGTFSLSKRLEYIKLGRSFNQIIEKDLFPSSLKKIKFGYEFNQSLESIPSSVTSIQYSGNFSKPQSVPSTVTKLILYNFFDKENLTVNDHIPKSIKSLRMDICFNNALVKGFIPNSVTKLVLGPKYFRCKLKPGVIPNSVTDLTITFNSFLTSIKKGVIPNSVRKLKILDLVGGIPYNLEYGSIPNGVESIIFSDFQTNCYLNLDRRLIPFSVKKLIIKDLEIDLSTLKYNNRFLLFYKNYGLIFGFILSILLLLFHIFIYISCIFITYSRETCLKIIISTWILTISSYFLFKKIINYK
ncbi:hypothetical protein ACTA71_009578 [Dictyostelium dimigraforme]